MTRVLFTAVLYVLTLTANAEPVTFNSVDGMVSISHDTDNLNVYHTWVGSTTTSGVGIRVGYSRYSGYQSLGSVAGYYGYYSPLTDTTQTFGQRSIITHNQLTANSTLAQITFDNTTDTYTLTAAVGLREVTYRVDTKNLSAANTYVTSSMASGADQYNINGNEVWYGTESQTNPRVSLSKRSRDTYTSIVGNVETNYIVNTRFTLGLYGATDIVESVRGIQTNTRYVYTAIGGDYQFTDTVSSSIIGGNNHFTDGNNRQFIRTKLIWTLLPDYGISTFVRTRDQWDSDPGSLNYFSPDNLQQRTVGLQMRKNYNGLVYTAMTEYGRESITTIDGITDAHPMYGWSAGIRTQPRKKDGLTYGATVTSTTSSGINGGGSDYTWYGATLWVKHPM